MLQDEKVPGRSSQQQAQIACMKCYPEKSQGVIEFDRRKFDSEHYHTVLKQTIVKTHFYTHTHTQMI